MSLPLRPWCGLMGGKGTAILNCACPKTVVHCKPSSLATARVNSYTLQTITTKERKTYTRYRTRWGRVQRKREHTHTSSNTGAKSQNLKQSSQTQSGERESVRVKVAQFKMVPFPGCLRRCSKEACIYFYISIHI